MLAWFVTIFFITKHAGKFIFIGISSLANYPKNDPLLNLSIVSNSIILGSYTLNFQVKKKISFFCYFNNIVNNIKIIIIPIQILISSYNTIF